MKRKIITIDQDACNGCGLCAAACHGGAIGMADGKAKLLRDDYCDGLGNCLPVCPAGAISFEEREAAEYDEDAVKANMAAKEASPVRDAAPVGGCPGSNARAIRREAAPPLPPVAAVLPQSQLRQWPVQLKLVPVSAAYFNGADLLIAADCAAYAHADFHNRFIKNHITLIGCPKLDETDYSEKLTTILSQNDIKSVTVVRMEVPCCGGLAHAVTAALQRCGRMIPRHTVTLSVGGEILEEL